MPIRLSRLLALAAVLAAVPSPLSAAGPDSRRTEDGARPEAASEDASSPDRDTEPAILNGGTAELHRLAESSPEAVLDQIGISVPDDCSILRSRNALERRTDIWELAVRILGETHPDLVFGWLTGTRRPPRRVTAEVRTMRNCLLDALFRDASRRETDLTVELEIGGREIRSPTRARDWAASYRNRPDRRERMREAVTKSHYRSASDQTEIWQRKTRFLGATFDRITPEAARACDLDAGDVWNPDLRRHQQCWRRELSAAARGREILAASAAPGLSRHHWGTEIDLFALSPSAFRAGRERHDEYRWLADRASEWGFYQAYSADDAPYVPERWHWSYEPISTALTVFVHEHLGAYEARLTHLWGRLEQRHNREHPTDLSFDYVRERWQRYVFGASSPSGE